MKKNLGKSEGYHNIILKCQRPQDEISVVVV